MLCAVYRSKRREGLYLYVEKQVGLAKVPEELSQRFGQTELALLLMVTPEKKLARTNGATVLAAIAERGYYLQFPPAPDSEMAGLAQLNSKLSL